MARLPTLSSRRDVFSLMATGAIGVLAWRFSSAMGGAAMAATAPVFTLTDAEWRKRLSSPAYAVLRKASTERPYTSPFLKEHRKGRFLCAGCDLPLFSSSTKFESGTGWPSFYDHFPRAIATVDDRSLGMERTEVTCARCAGHLGHVFEDGPRPTGLRYCMNGVALKFEPA